MKKVSKLDKIEVILVKKWSFTQHPQLEKIGHKTSFFAFLIHF